jgi:FkbM family methyltransferase
MDGTLPSFSSPVHDQAKQPGVGSMPEQKESVLQKLMHSETEWNPKVMLGRVILRMLPETAVHRLKKYYYAYLITHTPEQWMERDVFIAEHLIALGDHVLDIGASLGSFARFLAKRVGPEGQVYAFEPIPQTFDFLTNNMRKLQLKNVACLDFALSDVDKTETMVIPTYRWGQECWYDAQVKTPTSDPKWRQFEIKSRTLDHFFADKGSIPRISFIKCDANYHELAVLKGALQTIRASHPAMLIEVNPDPDDPTSSAYETFGLLRNEGYGAYWFDGQKLVERKPGERSQNYFFLTPEHARVVGAIHLSGAAPSR